MCEGCGPYNVNICKGFILPLRFIAEGQILAVVLKHWVKSRLTQDERLSPGAYTLDKPSHQRLPVESLTSINSVEFIHKQNGLSCVWPCDRAHVQSLSTWQEGMQVKYWFKTETKGKIGFVCHKLHKEADVLSDLRDARECWWWINQSDVCRMHHTLFGGFYWCK